MILFSLSPLVFHGKFCNTGQAQEDDNKFDRKGYKRVEELIKCKLPVVKK